MTNTQLQKLMVEDKLQATMKAIEDANASIMMAVHGLDTNVEEANRINAYTLVIMKENEKKKQLQETLEMLESLDDDK